MKPSKNPFIIVGLIFLSLIVGCKSFMPAQMPETSAATSVDFTAPGKPLSVKVELDKDRSASAKITRAGGTVSLTSADGSRFTLDVPENALDADTEIVMTAVKTLGGSPLGSSTPTAVQLEPSGLFFNELATLTIVPSKEIPVNEQIIFGYEADGKDYHLALVDPKSKEIKIKLQEFSGAGVGSGPDSSWASHLQIQADAARVRLTQRAGQVLQEARRHILLGGDDEADAGVKEVREIMDQFYDQVILKQMVSAELDCQFARKAIQDLLAYERQLQLIGYDGRADFEANIKKLTDIAVKCRRSYRIAGESNNVKFNGQACGLDKPFSLDAAFPGGTAKFTFKPASVVAGSTETTASGSGCSLTGGGDYSVTLSNDGSGTLSWTTTDTVVCQGVSNTRTNTFKVTLQPAPEVACD